MRFVVLCNKTDTNYMLYRFDSVSNHQHRRRMFDAFMTMSTLEHAHLLKIESVSYDDHGRLCVITPYTGNHEGLVTLADLLENRGGKLSTVEAARAIEHLLDAGAYAHAAGICNGPIGAEDVLVDRFGCIQIELYGCATLMSGVSASVPVLISDEIRSLADLGYTLMTGLPTTGQRVEPSRLIRRLDRAWDAWFELGLDPIDGFENATHAINAMPTNPQSGDWLTPRVGKRPQVQFGAMLRRFKPTQGMAARPRVRVEIPERD